MPVDSSNMKVHVRNVEEILVQNTKRVFLRALLFIPLKQQYFKSLTVLGPSRLLWLASKALKDDVNKENYNIGVGYK